MEDLSLHILDIVENSLRANARNIEIQIIENRTEDTLTLEVKDDGEGMSEETRAHAADPFFTTKNGKKTGLGLPFLAQSAREAGGKLEIESAEGKGTTVRAVFQRSHIDRKPIGSLEETLRCLTATHPGVNFCFDFESIGAWRNCSNKVNHLT